MLMETRQPIQGCLVENKRARLGSRLLLLAVLIGSINVVACMARPAASPADSRTEKTLHQNPVNQADRSEESSARQQQDESLPPWDDVTAARTNREPIARRAGAASVNQSSASTDAASKHPDEEAAAQPSSMPADAETHAAVPVTTTHAAGSSEPLTAIPAKSTMMQMLDWPILWFLAGLLLGLLVAACLFMLRRTSATRKHKASRNDSSRQIPALQFDGADQPELRRPTPMLDLTWQASAPSYELGDKIELETGSVATSAVEYLGSASLAIEHPRINTSIVVQNTYSALSSASHIAPAAAAMSSVEPPMAHASTPADQARLVAKDLRRARLLLEEGELESALAMIEPYLRDLQHEHSAVEIVEADGARSIARVLAALHADVRWQLARRSGSSEACALAASALETHLTFRPEDVPARLRLGRCLLDQANGEADELVRASLLQACVDALTGSGTEAGPDRLLFGMLGEACFHLALMTPEADPAAFAEAEAMLRQALAMGLAGDSDAAWWLQNLLATTVSTLDSATQSMRLQESIAMLRHGLSLSGDSSTRARWYAGLLRAELEEVRRTHLNAASRRLRLRDLHTHYAKAMLTEQSPEVLAAWVELLCALAEPLMGGVALQRYREVDDALARLLENDRDGAQHASAWLRMVHGRLRLENEAGKRELLQRTEAVLRPCLNTGDASLRLEASELALAQAACTQEQHVREEAYARALELARPLTVVPSVVVPALGCVLKALLAMRDDKERRVFASCLRIIEPDDAESLGLLAKSACRDGMYADACHYFEQASSKQTAMLPAEMLELWREANQRWAGQGGDNNMWQRNRHHLRVVERRRG